MQTSFFRPSFFPVSFLCLAWVVLNSVPSRSEVQSCYKVLNGNRSQAVIENHSKKLTSSQRSSAFDLKSVELSFKTIGETFSHSKGDLQAKLTVLVGYSPDHTSIRLNNENTLDVLAKEAAMTLLEWASLEGHQNNARYFQSIAKGLIYLDFSKSRRNESRIENLDKYFESMARFFGGSAVDYKDSRDLDIDKELATLGRSSSQLFQLKKARILQKVFRGMVRQWQSGNLYSPGWESVLPIFMRETGSYFLQQAGQWLPFFEKFPDSVKNIIWSYYVQTAYSKKREDLLNPRIALASVGGKVSLSQQVETQLSKWRPISVHSVATYNFLSKGAPFNLDSDDFSFLQADIFNSRDFYSLLRAESDQKLNSSEFIDLVAIRQEISNWIFATISSVGNNPDFLKLSVAETQALSGKVSIQFFRDLSELFKDDLTSLQQIENAYKKSRFKNNLFSVEMLSYQFKALLNLNSSDFRSRYMQIFEYLFLNQEVVGVHVGMGPNLLPGYVKKYGYDSLLHELRERFFRSIQSMSVSGQFEVLHGLQSRILEYIDALGASGEPVDSPPEETVLAKIKTIPTLFSGIVNERAQLFINFLNYPDKTILVERAIYASLAGVKNQHARLKVLSAFEELDPNLLLQLWEVMQHLVLLDLPTSSLRLEDWGRLLSSASMTKQGMFYYEKTIEKVPSRAEVVAGLLVLKKLVESNSDNSIVKAQLKRLVQDPQVLRIPNSDSDADVIANPYAGLVPSKQVRLHQLALVEIINLLNMSPSELLQGTLVSDYLLEFGSSGILMEADQN